MNDNEPAISTELGKETMKKLRKDMTKISEVAANVLHLGNSIDTDQITEAFEELTGSKMDKKTAAALKQHDNAQKEGEVEFLADFLKNKLGLNSNSDKDPFGNGNQKSLSGFQAMKLRTQWSTGFDYNPDNNGSLTDWCRACYYGDLDKVRKYIAGIVTEEDRKQLLERRESMIRFCGIFHVICGARMNPSKHHVPIATMIIEAGCRLDSKDIAGYTPLHHCLTMYGNTTTLQIAELLVKKGIDVNGKNRFGCTALFEPCMNFNYQFVEFLVCNGADTGIKDNDGISCQSIGTRNPRIHSLFSKGYRASANMDKKKEEAGSQGGEVCDHCGNSGKLSKCSGCLVVRYCSRACQTFDWKEHKQECKSKRKEKKAAGEIVYVKPVKNPEQGKGSIIMFNEKTKKVDVTDINAGNDANPEQDKTMKVKIQVHNFYNRLIILYCFLI